MPVNLPGHFKRCCLRKRQQLKKSAVFRFFIKTYQTAYFSFKP
jgi:hypothetical protein